MKKIFIRYQCGVDTAQLWHIMEYLFDRDKSWFQNCLTGAW